MHGLLIVRAQQMADFMPVRMGIAPHRFACLKFFAGESLRARRATLFFRVFSFCPPAAPASLAGRKASA